MHYLELNKDINTTKSKSDKKIIEEEYLKAKAELNSKMNSVSGLPSTAVSGTGGLAALSSISKSAQKAMSGIQGQYVSGVKSELRIKEDAEKVAALSSKLEWAKLVDQMSESSKVIILKEPRLLQEYEQTSPKLFTNILLGIVFGIIASLLAVILLENFDKRLTYSMLAENIIYNLEKDLTDLKMLLLANQNKNITLVVFEPISNKIIGTLKEFSNINMVCGDISKEFVDTISNSSEIILFAQINKTDAKLYKQVKTMIKDVNKNILSEVLL